MDELGRPYYPSDDERDRWEFSHPMKRLEDWVEIGIAEGNQTAWEHIPTQEIYLGEWN